MRRNAELTALAFASLVVLFFLETFLSYDTRVRQIALSVTDVFAFLVLLWLRQRLHRLDAQLAWPVAWSAAAGVWFDAMGNFLHLYGRLLWWDKLAHAVGAAAAALALWQMLRALRRLGRIVLSDRLTALFAAALAAGLTVLYEISEYIGDLLFQTHRVVDLYDSPDDLLWNAVGIGAILALAHILVRRRKQKIRPAPSSSSYTIGIPDRRR